MKRKIISLIFISWVVIWLFLLARELFAKGMFREYKALLGRSSEGKHSYVMGEDLYSFIKFCNGRLPQNATFTLEGIAADSIDMRRAVYYLYPNIKTDNPEFILVYRVKAFAPEGYVSFDEMGNNCFILRKAPR